MILLSDGGNEWQDDNNNNGDDQDDNNNNAGDEDGEDISIEDDGELDGQSSMSEEMPAISLPGHTAPPINYEGPEFPVRDLQPLPHTPAQQNSDELASRIKQADVLQTEVIDWLVCSAV